MYKVDRLFHHPPDDTVIWRYIDFTKFIDLLESHHLFFCRSDKFEDPFEGVLQLRDHELDKSMLYMQEETKKYYFLNCWHMNSTQSDAMWKIYLSTSNGIAIKSTIGRLKKSLQNSEIDVYLSQVYYRNFEEITYMELMKESQNVVSEGRGWSVNQFMYKRSSFEHEKELRAMYIDLPIPHAVIGGVERELLDYKKVNIEIGDLIEEVIIAPFADIWFGTLVKKMVDRFGYKFNITDSNLYNLK